MAARYQIWLKDTTGARVALIDDFRRLDYTHRVDAPGSCTLTINGNDDRVDLFVPDAQVEVWRSDAVNGIPLYLEWEGLHITERRETERDGRMAFTSYATGYLDLLARRDVAWAADSDGAHKDVANASTALYEYVYENAGAGATVAAGRRAAGVTAGLAMTGDPLVGAAWEGERSQKNLLDVLQGIAEDAGIDFDVLGTGAATFAFYLYNGQRGEDRTNTSIDKTTGLNSAGNAPIIFALNLGNMATPLYALSRDGTANRIYVLGQGHDATRTVEVRNDTTDQIVSPWNLREASRNATMEATTDGLKAVGDGELARMAPRESFSFQVLQVPSTLYGKHYTWGDRVTGRYQDIERSKRITGVRVSVRGGSGLTETISVELADVATWTQVR